MGTKLIALGALALAAAIGTYLAVVRSVEDDAGTAPNSGLPPRPTEPREPSATPVEAQRPLAVPPLEERLDPRPSLGPRLDEIATTFLGEEPRVAELLQVLGELAAQAVVDPGSLQVQRNVDGTLALARATLRAGGLNGTFWFEEGTYRVQFSGAIEQLPWSQRDLQFSFEQAAGRATGGRG